jgi:hypothetical protein
MMENKLEVKEFECSKQPLRRSYGLRGIKRVLREKGSSALLKMLAMVLKIGGSEPEYEQIGDGDKISVDWKDQGLNLACCDCALVHYITFEVIDNIIVMTFLRNEEETEKCREAKNIDFVEKFDE